jgi:cytochrome P450
MLLHISTSPRVLATLLAELASPPVPISTPISDAQARRLPYLQARIKEGMRMLASPVILFREVPKGGDVLSGLFVPEGTWVGFNFISLMMDKGIFGTDAKIFRPER